ncbi:peptidase S51 dipeptidase E [Gemmatirosa kalamazoonensis]|uniref:Peptidase S51 dipeptidase E n=1 Tax=Gemmatirosa kalamazoonensis TaxID=861299 RepID=W0RDW8_9BACT|nr:dipeptidase PepE [Gemmatirosa kalamazoonensis]AHG89001.1 peptidase S51 dipeptidase E [Gemmatirosa kalamazoonensis]
MLILLSNSRDPQGRYLHHCRDVLAELLKGVKRVTFVPYASVVAPWDDYMAKLRDALAPIGVGVDGVHRAEYAAQAIRDAEAIAVGGGNTFHLLQHLQESGALDALRERALAGVPYFGWSAGAVIAGPTIRTTNDMPIVEPPNGLGALGLVPFQINAHFTDLHPRGFQGETRRERLAEFLVANPTLAVVGLPEGDWLRVDGDAVTLEGPHEAVLFRDGEPAAALPSGVRVDRVLAGTVATTPSVPRPRGLLARLRGA